MMRNFFIYKSCRRLLAGLAFFIAASVQAVAVEELAVTITSLDVVANNVTLQDIDMVDVTYRLAFDVEIKLLSGENGTAGNLRVGDSITAIIDRDADVVYKLLVVGRGI